MQREHSGAKCQTIVEYELEVTASTRKGGMEGPLRSSLDVKFPSLDLDERTSRFEMKWAAWNGKPEPLFQPGRVLVSSEAMSRLGRDMVLRYLNSFVRGHCSEVSGGEEYWRVLEDDGVIFSTYWFSNDVGLSLRTNATRTLTVIRLTYESLFSRRLQNRLEAN